MIETATAPLKRVKELRPLSSEHHHGLTLCWKIRTGFAKNVSPERIKRYTDWFYMKYLLPHFELEEEHVFPILNKDNELVRKACADHRRLRRLFNQAINIELNLGLIEEELEAHIRFEERVLFPEIQEWASSDQLRRIEEIHREEEFVENVKDVFWK